MRKNALISCALNDAGLLVFTVGEGAGSFELNPAELPEEIRNRALIHGLVQKISDAAAIAKAELPKDKAKAAKMKFDAMLAVRNRLVEGGDWSQRRGDGSGPVAGIIYRAFEQWVENRAKAVKKPVPDSDAIRARYDAMERKEQLALRNIPEVAAIMERIKSERGTDSVAAIDTDALLGDLIG